MAAQAQQPGEVHAELRHRTVQEGVPARALVRVRVRARVGDTVRVRVGVRVGVRVRVRVRAGSGCRRTASQAGR